MNYRNKISNIRSEGGVLPHDILSRIQSGDSSIPGITPKDYHLDEREKLSEEISRVWYRLLDKWKKFEEQCGEDPEKNSKTGQTRDRWLLPVFSELGFGWLPKAQPMNIGEIQFSISHQWNNVPIHLLGANVNLDYLQSGVAGAAKLSPHGLVQDFLNRSSQHKWGIVSNGLQFRLLRDYHSLTKQSFVEFDLQAIMRGGYYNEFVLFWMIFHQSCFESENLKDCRLEQWFKLSLEEGVRALENLRGGVKDAIETIGSALISNKSNEILREKLRNGNLDQQEFYRQLLRLVYRLIFLFVAEERDVLLEPDAEEFKKNTYFDFYSTRRLRILADKHRGGGHSDLWKGLKILMSMVNDGCPDLALPALGSRLWNQNACIDILYSECSNEYLLEAIRKLSTIHEKNTTYLVNWRNIGSIELGSVYESLLELRPQLDFSTGKFRLDSDLKSERKYSGAFYTPTEIVELIVNSALDPVINEACNGANPIEKLLNLKVCDPACGSGHFLLAAARRIAMKLASIRIGGDEYSPKEFQHALREVISKCIYGVDVNPMAVELCKVNLWMEGIEPGKPLSFLDSHIQCGNALIGATPEGMKGGIPDSAFTLLDGDDKKILNKIKEVNKRNRRDSEKGQVQYGMIEKLLDNNNQNQNNFVSIANQLEDTTFEDVFSIRNKEKLWDSLSESDQYKEAWFHADSWCAAFVWPKNNETNAEAAITDDRWYQILANTDNTPNVTREIVKSLVKEHKFFHWHLAFPHIFNSELEENNSYISQMTGWRGGFDCVLGNPPWVRQELLKKYKSILSGYKSYAGRADTYVYFLELSLKIISRTGTIGMLTPNKWFRTNYAVELRKLIKNNSQIKLIVDFGSTDTIFPGATTYPSVIVVNLCENSDENEKINMVKVDENDRNKLTIQEIVHNKNIKISKKYLNDCGWVFEEDSINQLLQKLNCTFPKLIERIDEKPIIGVKTYLNDAYYFDSKTYDSHIARYPKEQMLFKKIHRGRDIERWNTPWNGTWQLFIDSSSNPIWPWSLAKSEYDAEEIFRISYPGIFEHMKIFEKKLRKRASHGKYWWELSPRSKTADTIYNNPKIILQEITTYSSFSLEDNGLWVNNKILSIPTCDLYVLGVLNSRIIWWLMHRNFNLLQSDGINIDIEGLSCLPIPNESIELRNAVINQVKICMGNQDLSTICESEKVLNGLIYQVFNLNDKEIKLIENSLPPRDPLCVISS